MSNKEQLTKADRHRQIVALATASFPNKFMDVGNYMRNNLRRNESIFPMMKLLLSNTNKWFDFESGVCNNNGVINNRIICKTKSQMNFFKKELQLIPGITIVHNLIFQYYFALTQDNYTYDYNHHYVYYTLKVSNTVLTTDQKWCRKTTDNFIKACNHNNTSIFSWLHAHMETRKYIDYLYVYRDLYKSFEIDIGPDKDYISLRLNNTLDKIDDLKILVSQIGYRFGGVPKNNDGNEFCIDYMSETFKGPHYVEDPNPLVNVNLLIKCN